MLTNPRPGQRCRIHYARDYAHTMPHHGKTGEIVLASQAWKGRNHLVKLDSGKHVAVPAGNLVAVFQDFREAS